MVIKKYRANNMNEAITRIKYELGSEAVIISQRKVRKKGIVGFFSKKILEVTAAVDNKKREENMNYGVRTLKKIVDNGLKNNQQEDKKKDAVGGAYESSLVNKNNDELIKEVQQMKGMLTKMMNNPCVNVGKSELQVKLENSDLNEKVIKKILGNINIMEDDRKDEEKLKEVVQNMVKVDNRKLSHAVVLIGPTGVGKTTTIAKLAGRMALVEKRKIGLITIDTYRIGAVEQLRTYADIMNIPFKVVFTMKDMEKTLREMDSCDTILIDTTGRNSKNKMQISELRAFIDKVRTDNIHLVISCTTKNKDIDAIVEGYKQLNYSDVIITKLDETCTYGSVLNILQAAKKPISFVTTGQNVPEDIKSMSSEELAKLVLGEDIIC
ncbi:MAG TPA: flagellar biosynthesis protein FlhF [Clostridium sp.]|jgi:flagellar biosynthesis protein FlhF|uniref:Flagellar biosynthesis protein FlhF n=1 Tax=Clostridium lapidicellarium TaxID=3240931 RepID=A0ABV4DSX6_9CLOT|nr:flagellar biosynthesis protein FlhF [uncultured Clostridium sp.]NLU08018.1 flagellar biosynthesis protein FlhF [Clostridiales bacterium]HBC95901.1 flagellar biosynthesis protein FlhF [Clostridium sp.]